MAHLSVKTLPCSSSVILIPDFFAACKDFVGPVNESAMSPVAKLLKSLLGSNLTAPKFRRSIAGSLSTNEAGLRVPLSLPATDLVFDAYPPWNRADRNLSPALDLLHNLTHHLILALGLRAKPALCSEHTCGVKASGSGLALVPWNESLSHSNRTHRGRPLRRVRRLPLRNGRRI